MPHRSEKNQLQVALSKMQLRVLLLQISKSYLFVTEQRLTALGQELSQLQMSGAT